MVNLGAQVEVPRLVATAAAEGADAVLVSQVVTQRDAHLADARELARALAECSASDPGRRPLLVIGGPRFDPAGARPGRGQDLRQGHHAPRGGQLLGPRRRRASRDRGVSGSLAGLSVAHRRYVSYSHAHYGGNLVDGAYVLGLFGDVGTELCIRSDGDEGLFASYSDVQFLAPVRAGDVIEVTATLTRWGLGAGASPSRPVSCAGRTRAEGRRPPWSWPSPSWW